MWWWSESTFNSARNLSQRSFSTFVPSLHQPSLLSIMLLVLSVAASNPIESSYYNYSTLDNHRFPLTQHILPLLNFSLGSKMLEHPMLNHTDKMPVLHSHSSKDSSKLDLQVQDAKLHNVHIPIVYVNMNSSQILQSSSTNFATASRVKRQNLLGIHVSEDSNRPQRPNETNIDVAWLDKGNSIIEMVDEDTSDEALRKNTLGRISKREGLERDVMNFDEKTEGAYENSSWSSNEFLIPSTYPSVNSTTLKSSEGNGQETAEWRRSRTDLRDLNRKPEKNVIYIHGLFEKSGTGCRTQLEAGPYELKAAMLAIEHINQKDVLKGYRLKMIENDTKCDSGVAVDSFFYSLYKQPIMTMLLGTGSSEVTERLARVVSRWNVIQVSYGASSPALSDRKNFPFFFRTVAPDSSNNAALLAFIQHFRWDTVATLHEQGDNHALPMNKLVSELEQSNISVSLTKGVSKRDYKEHLQELKAQDCRILIGSFSYSLVRKIFCYVYQLEMFGAEYAWLLQGDLKEAWWNDAEDTDCTKSQLAKAARGVIMVGSHYMPDANSTTKSGISVHQLLQDIGFFTDPRNSGFVSQSYDAVWAMALALEQARDVWRQSVDKRDFHDFSYTNFEMAEDMATVLGKLKFMGVSGPVSFHNSDRVGITSFHQYQGGKELPLVSLHYPGSEELNFECKDCVDIMWQGDRVPIARRIIRLRVAVLDRRVVICVTSLAVFGVILALTFLSFNLYYRKYKFIKLSSPNLNNFVIVGCILVYVAMILLGMDHASLASVNHFGFVCSSRAFLLSGGFSLAFGCMFIKTYRVYHIFIRSSTGIVRSKLLHDQQLLAMVSALVMIDCILVTLWVTLDPMERQLRNLTMQVYPSERNVVYLYQREQCHSGHMAKWLGSLYFYKGLLLIVGCYMAWETRHVKIPALNDSQYIGMSVYNVVITSVIGVALANVIPVERYTLTFVLVSALIFVSTTMTLCLLFVPKIHTILTTEEDESAVVATPGVKVEFKTRRFAVDEPRESMYRAEVLNRALKRELLELENELAKLSAKAGIILPGFYRPKPAMMTTTEPQDEESDDELPPWLSEYRKYPPNGNDGTWYSTERNAPSACFSVLSAVHPLFMSAVDYTQTPAPKPSILKQPKLKEVATITEEILCEQDTFSGGRGSMPCMDPLTSKHRKVMPAILDPVRSCASERALNKIKHGTKHLKLTNWSLTKLNKRHLSALDDDTLRHRLYSKSATRLQNSFSITDVSPFATPPTGSLPKISSDCGSRSEFSGNNGSLCSEWDTAPTYSSSFATARDNEGSSSNNRTLTSSSEAPEEHWRQRTSLTDSSSRSSNGFFSIHGSSNSNSKADVSRTRRDSDDYTNAAMENLVLDAHGITRQDRDTIEPKVRLLLDLEQASDINASCNDHIPSSSIPSNESTPVNSATPLLALSNRNSDSSTITEEHIQVKYRNEMYPNNTQALTYASSLCNNSGSLDGSSNTLSVIDDTGSTNSEIFTNRDGHVKCRSINDDISKPITMGTTQERTSCFVEENPSILVEEGQDISDQCDTRTIQRDQDPVDDSIGHTSLNYDDSRSNNSRRQCEDLRHQIFQLERDLILLELDNSESVDL